MTEIKYNHLNWPICRHCKAWNIYNTKKDPWGLEYAKCNKIKDWRCETSSCEHFEHY